MTRASAALFIALLLASCGRSLTDLGTFPCARDSTCPTGYRCDSGTCLSAHAEAPPLALTYSSPAAEYAVGTAILPNSPSSSGGVPAGYAVAPTLPDGLQLDPITGVISGTPMAPSATVLYSVTAANSAGSTQVGVTITVDTALQAPTGLVYSLNPAVYSVSTPIPANTPSLAGGAVASYGVAPALPAGLWIDPVTGQIAGTPSVATASATYVVTAANAAGSTTTSVQITVTAAPTAPSGLTYSVNPAVYTMGSPIVPDTPSARGGAPAWFSVSPPLPAGLTLNVASGVVTGTPTSVAPSATYTVAATNAAGSTPVALVVTVVAALAAPSSLTYSVNPAVYTVGATIAPNAPSSGGGPVASYTTSPALPLGLSLASSTGLITGTPAVVVPTAAYAITATNGAGSTTTGLSIAVNAALAPPSGLTYSANPATYTVGVAIAGNAPSSSGGAVASYSVSPALPAGLALDATTGVITGTPSAASAATSYTITARNAAGSTTTGVSITVNAALAPPTNLTYSTNPATYTVGTAVTPNTPSSGGGAVASYSVSPGLPPGLTLDTTTGVITGTPSAASATATYTITATNAAGSTTASLSITVNAALAPPSNLTYSTNPATYTAGTPISPNTPSSSGGAVASYSVSPALPPGLALDTASGFISGTPTALTLLGTYTVTARNAAGSATVGLVITVLGL